MVRRTVIALAALLMAAAAPAAANGPLNFPFPRMHADSRAPGGLMDRHSGGAASLQLRDNKFLATMAKAKVAVKETIDLDKYPKLFGAGGFCAAITHFVTVPLDVVKTRLQVNPGEFSSLGDGISKIYKTSGIPGLFTGVTPTTCGFLLQGSLKYGFYELFKDIQKQNLPQEKGGDKGKLPIPQVMLAATAAEILGTTALLPFESARIRAVADPSFAPNMFASLGKLVRTQGIAGIYGGLIPIMCKQIPFTITQFLVFEAAATVIYKEFAKRDFKDVGAKFGTGITFGCGVMSGVAAAIVSQPGDTVLSVMNKAPGTNLFQAVQQLGPAGMYRGLGARCVHVTSFIAAQFLIYDSIKRAFGIEVAGEAAGKAHRAEKKK